MGDTEPTAQMDQESLETMVDIVTSIHLATEQRRYPELAQALSLAQQIADNLGIGVHVIHNAAAEMGTSAS